MDTIVYRPTWGSRVLARICGAIAVLLGFMLLICPGLFILLLLTTGEIAPESRGDTIRTLLILALAAGALTIGVLLSVSANWGRVELSPATIREVAGGPSRRSTIVPLMEKVWVVRIETAAGASLDLDLGGRGYAPRYDLHPILRDLLPRLPAAAQVDPRLRQFAATGQLRWEDLLGDR